MDGSLNRLTLPKLGSLELPLQLCRNPEIPCLSSTLFFLWRTAQTRAPRGRRPHLCILLTRWSSVWKWVRVGRGLILASPLQNRCLCWFVLCWSVTGLCGCTHGLWELRDGAASPPPLFCLFCPYNLP